MTVHAMRAAVAAAALAGALGLGCEKSPEVQEEEALQAQTMQGARALERMKEERADEEAEACDEEVAADVRAAVQQEQVTEELEDEQARSER